jgi:histidinol-phosphate/aromatic aminotransferase/cobyric acid decarboxylase-like protein
MKAPSIAHLGSRPADGISSEWLAQLGLDASDVLDLCTGQNPNPVPERVAEAATSALFDRHPDPQATRARRAVAERFGLDPEQVLLGHGASELMWSCAQALLPAGAVLLAIEPSHTELSTSARQNTARVARWRSVERTGHRVDLEQIGELIKLEQPNVVSLCAPGSPTGASVPFAELCELASGFESTTFVVDQTWLELSDDHADLELPPQENVVCVRSLSRAFALPGLRAGYLVGSSARVARIAAARPGPGLSVSSPAQAAVQASLHEQAFLAASRSQLQAGRERLAGVLRALGLVFTPSVAPFLLLRIARAEEVARELLERHRVAVCDATPFGLPDHVRIAALREPDAPQLTAALRDVLARRGLVAGREP